MHASDRLLSHWEVFFFCVWWWTNFVWCHDEKSGSCLELYYAQLRPIKHSLSDCVCFSVCSMHACTSRTVIYFILLLNRTESTQKVADISYLVSRDGCDRPWPFRSQKFSGQNHGLHILSLKLITEEWKVIESRTVWRTGSLYHAVEHSEPNDASRCYAD